MFRIGEFSQIARVTIDTLRHYDELGLLKPAQVDPLTGYRYYSARQLRPLHRILALKEIGLSLEEIARILQEKLTNDQLREMLKAQLARAESEIEAARLRQEGILARLDYLNSEETMPAYEVTLKPVEAQTIAAIREIVPTIEQMPERCNQMFNAIGQWLAAHRLPAGAPMTIYYNEGYSRENIDTECAFVLPDTRGLKGVAPEEPIRVRHVEAIPLVASTIATNDFYNKVDGLGPAYSAIAQWIEDHNYQIVGPPRELYYGSPASGDLTAEIQFPVKKV
jgi:DNA-binding transcriptional MerR regulator